MFHTAPTTSGGDSNSSCAITSSLGSNPVIIKACKASPPALTPRPPPKRQMPVTCNGKVSSSFSSAPIRMPLPSTRTQAPGYETGPGPLHYKLRANTVDRDKVGMRYLADGTEAPVYLDKCGRRMPVVPEIAREGWVTSVYQMEDESSTGMANAIGDEEREAWGDVTLGLEWGWTRGLGDERRVW